MGKAKPIVKDSKGELWVEKTYKKEEEFIREYLGSELLNLMGLEGVKSPKIKKGRSGKTEVILSSYINDMAEYMIYGYGRPKNQPNLNQKQVVLVSLIIEDFDRNFANYGWCGSDLIVIDQAGGYEKINLTKEKWFETALKHFAKGKLIPPNSVIDDYTLGIDILQKRATPQVIEKILTEAGLEEEKLNEHKSKIIENIANLEKSMEKVIGYINENYITTESGRVREKKDN